MREQTHGLLHLGQALFPQAPFVERVALNQMVAERAGGPDAELGAALGIDSVAHGEDGIEVEVLDLVGLAVRSSCCIFCNNCLPIQLPSLEDVPQMPGYYGLIPSEQLGHLAKRQPDGLPLQAHVEAYLPIGCLVEGDLSAELEIAVGHAANVSFSSSTIAFSLSPKS